MVVARPRECGCSSASRRREACSPESGLTDYILFSTLERLIYPGPYFVDVTAADTHRPFTQHLLRRSMRGPGIRRVKRARPFHTTRMEHRPTFAAAAQQPTRPLTPVSADSARSSQRPVDAPSHKDRGNACGSPRSPPTARSSHLRGAAGSGVSSNGIQASRSRQRRSAASSSHGSETRRTRPRSSSRRRTRRSTACSARRAPTMIKRPTIVS